MTTPTLDKPKTDEKAKVCGATYTRKTPKGEAKTYTCQRAAGHPKGKTTEGHGPAELTPATLASLDTFEAVPDDVKVEYGGGNTAAEPDALDVRIRQHVKDAHESWQIQKKKSFNDMPRKRYTVNPAESADFRRRLRAAAKFHNVGIRIAPDKPEAKMDEATKRMKATGKVMIFWAAPALPEKKKETETPKTEAAA